MEEATQNVIDIQIPALQELCSSGSLSVDNIDVFCEKGVFDTDASRRILKAGKEAGWKINFHGDEIHPMNSGEVPFVCYKNITQLYKLGKSKGGPKLITVPVIQCALDTLTVMTLPLILSSEQKVRRATIICIID